MKFKFLLIFILIIVFALISCVPKVNVRTISKDDLLILAGYIEGVIIAEISDPSNIREVSVIDTDEYSYLVKTKGDYIFDVERYGGLRIIDASDFYNPKVIKEIEIDNNPIYDVSLKDNYMFLAAYNDGLKLYNIDDVLSPTEIGKILDGRITGVSIIDDIAYVRNEYPHEVVLFDVSDPSSPTLVSKISMNSYSTPKVVVNNDYAYIPDSKTLKIYDISKPASPIFVDSYNFDYKISSIFSSNNNLYISSNINLFIFDISTPSTINLLSEYSLEDDNIYSSYIEDVFVKNYVAYLSLESDGLLVLDVSDKSSPTFIQLWDNGYAPESAIVKNNFLYVSDGSYGLSIFDINDISNPKKLSSVTLDDYFYVYETVVTDEYAFIAADNYFLIADISNSQNPNIVYVYPDDGSFYNLFYKYPYLYTTGDTLRILDVSDPSSPIVLVDNFENISGALRDLYVKDNIAYIANITNGISIVDVSDPSSPVFIKNLNTGYYTYDVFVEGNYAYAISYGNGLTIIDITHPSSPATISSLNVADGYNGIFVKNNYAYLAAGEEGLIIIDVSDPLNLSINDVVKTIPTYYAAEVYVDNNYAYIADYDNGIVIFDIQDPENAFIKKDMLYMYFYGCTGF